MLALIINLWLNVQMENTNQQPIIKAAEIAGGMSSLASLCNVTPQAVFKWVKKNKAPADRCIKIEELTNGLVTRYELRPDVFGKK
jgi:DNA-binding transcriptional regulator YdaS (Cro superfamily)